MRLLEKQFLSSKVARRVFTLFAVSALLPILSLAVLHHFQAAALLVEHANDQLHAASSNYGATLQERLGFAEQMLHDAAEELNGGLSIEQAREGTTGFFDKLDLVTDLSAFEQSQAGYQSAQSVPNTAQARILGGESALLTRIEPDNSTTVLMLRALVPKRSDSGILVGKIDGTYLWRQRNQGPNGTDLCVLDHQQRILTCSSLLISRPFEKYSASRHALQPAT